MIRNNYQTKLSLYTRFKCNNEWELIEKRLHSAKCEEIDEMMAMM